MAHDPPVKVGDRVLVAYRSAYNGIAYATVAEISPSGKYMRCEMCNRHEWWCTINKDLLEVLE